MINDGMTMRYKRSFLDNNPFNRSLEFESIISKTTLCKICIYVFTCVYISVRMNV